MKTCPKCSLIIENDSARFCKRCGTNIEKEPITQIKVTEDFIDNKFDVKIIDTIVQKTPQIQPTTKSVISNTYTFAFDDFFTFVLWMIVLGGILTPIIGMMSFNVSDYSGSLCLILSDLSIYILTPINSIYSVVSTYKRRTGSIALLIAYLITILFFKILAQLLIGFKSIDVFTLVSLIWNTIFLLYICFSENIRNIFPNDIRRTSNFDKLMIWSYILIPLINLLIGYIQIIFMV